MKEHTIGFVGQGWIGKNYADDFERRGYKTIRYSLEPDFVQNKDRILDCQITFIAVPTPTTPEGFDDSYLRDALTVIAPRTIAVIKSTVLPGSTNQLQLDFPDLFILHSPEFLVEKTAAYDASNPQRNLIGIPVESPEYRAAADMVLSVLPPAPYAKIMSTKESELVKYAGNCFLYTKVLFMNILYDVAVSSGADWELLRESLSKDPRIGESHTNPVHQSGRGAGGHCFIKDFEAYRQWAKAVISDQVDVHTLLDDMVLYNNRLLKNSDKDLDLLTGVYGQDHTI